MTTTECSARYCQGIATRFDGSTWMFACTTHETKWRNQMIELGVASLTSHCDLRDDPLCAVQGCDARGHYRMDDEDFCMTHAEIGAVCAFTDFNNDVAKVILRECENNHKVPRVDNAEHPCNWSCGKKLKSVQ